MMQDLWASQRERLQEQISRSLAEQTFSSGLLVREQVAASDPADYEVAALACLAAAKAVGGSEEAALPGAGAMAYLSQMALVFMGLENSGGSASLSTAWGMPRSLNAGDAMFALAQESLLSTPDELTAEVRLQAMSILDAGSRDLLDALFSLGGNDEPIASGQAALLSSAMALGGLLGGADQAAWERLGRLGREWSVLPPEELSRMLAGDPAGWLASSEK